MNFLISLLCGLLAESVIPGLERPRKRVLHQVLLEQQILWPMRQRLAMSNAIRFCGAAIGILGVVLFFHFSRSSQPGTFSQFVSLLREPRTLLEGGGACLGLYGMVCATQLLCCGVGHPRAPQEYFEGHDMQNNPVRTWVFNACQPIETESQGKTRLQIQHDYVRRCLDENASFHTPTDLGRMHDQIEQQQYDHTRLAEYVGTLSWSSTFLQLFLILIGAGCFLVSWSALGQTVR